MASIEEQIREAWRASGRSMLSLSEETGLRYQSVHGFLKGYRDLRLASASKLCNALGLELRPVAKPEAAPTPKARKRGKAS